MGDHKSKTKGLPMTVPGNPRMSAGQPAEGAINSERRQSEGYGTHQDTFLQGHETNGLLPMPKPLKGI